MVPPPDPRPLRGEPISLDLLNTTWIDAAGRHDLLEDLSGLRTWLHAHGIERTPLSEVTRAALVRAREALRVHVSDQAGYSAAPATGAAAAARAAAAAEELNAVLARGALVRALDEQGPATRIVVDDPADLPAWTAVEDYLQLLARDPARIRRCDHLDCVLHFYDTSKRGDRRWCSMAGCGNRAKSARHYAKSRQTQQTLTD